MDKRFRYIVTIKKRDSYGNIVKTYPGIFIASDVVDLKLSIRQAVNATYDDFRRFWSHDFTIDRIEEYEEPVVPVTIVNNYINKEENDVLGQPATDGD